jgi:hypothetical protein
MALRRAWVARHPRKDAAINDSYIKGSSSHGRSFGDEKNTSIR